MADQVPHDEEVGGEAHLLDDLQLVLDPVPDFGGGIVAVSVSRSLVDQPPEIARPPSRRRDREAGQEDPPEVEVDIDPLGDREGVVTSPGEGVGREEALHLLRGLQIMLVAFESQSARLGPERAGLDAQQDIMGVVLGAMGVMGVVGGEQGRPGPG